MRGAVELLGCSLPRPGSASFQRTQFCPELILSGRRVPENFHRGGGRRNRSEPIARLRDSGACGHYVVYLLHGALGRLLRCRLNRIFARTTKCRCAKCERRNQCTTGDGDICFLHYAASLLMLIVIPVRQVSQTYRSTSRYRADENSDTARTKADEQFSQTAAHQRLDRRRHDLFVKKSAT